MSWVDRFSEAIMAHSRAVIAIMLVLTVVVGAGAGMIEQSSSLDQFQSDSTEAQKLSYVEENFTTGQENTTSAQVIVRGENVLSQESMLRPMSVGGERVYRDGAREDVWVRDEETGGYILRDGAGEVHARFPDAKSIFEDVDRYPDVGDEATDDMRTIKTPIIPAYEFEDGEVPEPDEEWFVITVPATDDETLSVSDLSIYVDGMTVPLESLGRDDEDGDSLQDDSDDGPHAPSENEDGDVGDGESGTLDRLLGGLD